MDEVKHDIVNYQCRGLSYLLKLKAEADYTGMILWLRCARNAEKRAVCCDHVGQALC